MIETEATGKPVERSLAACLASLLEVELGPIPTAGEAPMSVRARQWLAGRGLGLVTVADPQTFAWAGPWNAQLTDDERADRLSTGTLRTGDTITPGENDA